ncbi:hypothetical protein E8Q24_28510 [Salmonella enterica]|nr:hypothetical protein [Salmonella enterica subsp. enterica serovar Dahomey]EDQ6637559.1 hypothetical protein [Salmonella enterica subsp. enterica]
MVFSITHRRGICSSRIPARCRLSPLAVMVLLGAGMCSSGATAAFLTPPTGRSRVMAGGYANGLLGYGDQLRVDLLDAYEKSDLFNGSLNYSLLAGGHGPVSDGGGVL